MAEERIAFKDRFDKDHDGFLGTEEIKLWLAPNEKEFFEEEAKHLLKHSDKDEVREGNGIRGPGASLIIDF